MSTVDSTQPVEDGATAAPQRGNRLGQLFALICGAVGLAFIGVYYAKRRNRERTPAEAADAAVTAAIAARARDDDR
ncbi:MAG: hypothetical protein NVS2B3_06460 [Vulcanimicrobiaceae bacterium]